MRGYDEVQVQRAAVHIVGPRRGVLVQSSAELDLTEPVMAFIAGHVTQGLGDSQALAANFKVTGPDRTEGICRRIIESGTDFVARSGALAQRLYEASSTPEGSDTRVSDGTLVVARCAATDDSSAKRSFVALLKLDPGDAFRAEPREDAKGRPIVALVPQSDILPTPRERLQKAAFVRGAGAEFDALVLDRQRRGEVVSAFFLEGFLGLEHVYDAEERTRRLYRTLLRTFNEVKDGLSSIQYARLEQYIQGQVVGGAVNVDSLVEGMPVGKVTKQRFAQALDTALPDREFETDARTAEALVRKRRFRGDNGLVVTVASEFYGEMVKTAPPKAPGGDYTITIRTREWSER